jgi:O-antigen/teichoic acid export membrane protein
MVISLGEAIVYACSFVRNMILARLLTKADFGIAATFAMVILLLEFSAKLGVSRFVVQDKQGDRADFLATTHLVQFCASVLSSLVIAAAAWPMARLLELEEEVAAFFILALLPLIHGLAHLDVRRYERNLRFGPSALVGVVPQILITILVWPLGIWLRDYRVVLVLMFLKALLSLGGTHWLAEQPYRWRMQREYIRRVLRFGWPLVVNSWFMFVMLRGDQFVVASLYSMAEFGAYAAAATLALVPTLFFTRVFASVLLPLMAKVQDDAVAFNRRYGLVIAVICAFSATYAGAFIIGSEIMMQIVFGRKYEGTGIILACLTAANALRNIRLATAISAMAKGDSKNEMISNLGAGVGLVTAYSIALGGNPVWMIACAGLLGEFVACSVSFLRLTRRDGVPLIRSLVPASLVVVAVVLSGGIHLILREQGIFPLLELLIAGVAGCVFGGMVILLLRDSRREARMFFLNCRAGGWRKWLPRGRNPQ